MTSSDILKLALNVSLETYISAMSNGCQNFVRTPSGTWWSRNERMALTRFPNHQLQTVSEQDTSFLFRESHPLLLDWTSNAVEGKASNALLYLYDELIYDIEERSKPARRDARRALRELDFRIINHEELLDIGFPVFANTRIRNGLNDGTILEFRKRFKNMTPGAGYTFLGAFSGQKLAGFLSILYVDDWVSIGPYAHSDYRSSCPSDGLLYLAMDHFINTRNAHLISYGLSSVQEESSRQGLHTFKTKVGFKAIQVNRCFELHPWIAPCFHGVGGRLFLSVLKLLPANRITRKMSGALKLLLS